jgi:hypothetical protein
MMTAADLIGGPYRRYATEASVLAEGQMAIANHYSFDHVSAVSDPAVDRLMVDFFDDPDFVRRLFAFVTELGIAFARAQIHREADLTGVGDAAASLVGPDIYESRTFL